MLVKTKDMSKRRSDKARYRKELGPKRKKVRVIPEFEGTALMSREGFVFVRIEGQEEDVFVKASKTRGALHGDKVRVAVTQEKVGSIFMETPPKEPIPHTM